MLAGGRGEGEGEGGGPGIWISEGLEVRSQVGLKDTEALRFSEAS